MKFRLRADEHLGSPIGNDLEPILEEVRHDNTLFLGDIFDFANMLVKEIPYYEKIYREFCEKHKGNYIHGNHSRRTIRNELIIRTNEKGERIVFAHGDLESDPEKWTEYRTKPLGAGWFKRKFIIPFIREAEEIIERKPKKDFLERASSLAKSLNCSYYVCGHFHPKEKIQVTYNDVKIIILPRGLTILDL